MKYALNHEWRFDNWKVAFWCGFLQASIILIVELVNFLCIMSSTQVLDVVMNFLALVVISDFDDFFYGALGNKEECKAFLFDPCYSDLLTIERTSSRRARLPLADHVLTADAIDIPDELERQKLAKEGSLPQYIYAGFFERGLVNAAAMCVYRVMRVVYVSVWFYFLPFIILFGSYYVPYYLQQANATPEVLTL